MKEKLQSEEEKADIFDDNHNEISYDWRDRCKILDIYNLCEEIKKYIKNEKKKSIPNSLSKRKEKRIIRKIPPIL